MDMRLSALIKVSAFVLLAGLTEVDERPARGLTLKRAFPYSWISEFSEFVIRRWAHLHTLL